MLTSIVFKETPDVNGKYYCVEVQPERAMEWAFILNASEIYRGECGSLKVSTFKC